MTTTNYASCSEAELSAAISRLSVAMVVEDDPAEKNAATKELEAARDGAICFVNSF